MKTKLLLIAVCVLIAIPSIAQNSNIRTKCTYQGEANFAYATKSFADDHSFGIETIQGIRINRYIFVGIGAGVNFNMLPSYDYDPFFDTPTAYDNDGSFVEIPIYADVKIYYPTKVAVKPYLNIWLNGQKKG